MKKKSYNVLFPYDGESFGGSNVSSIILFNVLKKSFNASIYLFRPGKFSAYLDKENIQYSFFKSRIGIVNGSNILKYFKLVLTLKHALFLLKHKIKVVHTNEIDMHLTWFIPCMITRTKHIWHQRTPNNRSVNLAYFSHLIAVSNYTKQSFPLFLQPKTLKVYNPYLLSNSLVRKAPKGILKIGYIGNLVDRKRVLVFIDVIKNLNISVEAYIFGDKREPLYSIAKKKVDSNNLQDKIKFMGLVFPIEEYLKNIDIVISPAVNEALGRNIIESMSLGIPVLALNSGGNGEIITDCFNGFLIQDNSINDYVSVVNRLSKDSKLYAKISKNAIETVKARFDSRIHFKAMLNLYNSITQ